MPAAKILVVEDEGLTAMELQRKLKFWGYDVPTFAFSRKEAVKKAIDTKPDLILMDIVLKGEGDGIDAVQEIKNELNIPIIYLTAYGDENTLKRADSTEPFDYILKPFEENALHKSIENALRRHKFEKKLNQLGESLNKKLIQSGSAVIVADKNGSVKYINEVAENLICFKKEEIHLKNLEDIFRVRKLSENPFKGEFKIFEYGPPLKCGDEEVFLSRPGLNEIPIEYNTSPIKDAEGETVGSTLIFNDISEKFNTKKIIRQGEKRFKDIYLQSPVGMVLFGLDGNIMEANGSALDLLGVDKTKKLKDFNFFKDFKLKNIKKDLSNGVIFKYQVEFDFDTTKTYETKRSGSVDLEIILKQMGDQESGISYLAQLHDITEYRNKLESIKRGKEKYNKILSSIKSPLLVLDKDLYYVFSNESFKDLLSIQNDGINEKSMMEILPDFIDQKKVEESVLNTLKTKESKIITFVYTQNNEKKLLEFNIQPFDDGVSIFLKDVTSDKAMENELKNREKLYKSFVEDLTHPICCFDSNGTITFTNKSYNHYFGDDVLGGFVFSIPLNEQNKMKKYLESFYEAEPVKILESPIKMSDGNLQWWKWVTKAVYHEGNIIEFQSVGHEVTGERKLEQEMNNTIEQLEKELYEKSEYYASAKKSLESKLTEKINEMNLLNDRSRELEGKVRRLSEVAEKYKEDLDIAMKDRNELENNHKQTIEMLKNKIEKHEIDHGNSLRKLQNELKALMKIGDDLKSKNQILEDDLKEVTAKLSNTIKTKDLEINKHKESKEILELMANDLKRHVETKNSALERVNKDLNNEIVKRKKIEKTFKGNIDKLEKQLNDKTAEFNLKKKIIDDEILDLNNELEETNSALKQKENLLKDVHNRVKRNMQRISSLTGLQSEYIRDQILENIAVNQKHIKSIALVHEKLYESQDLEKVDFDSYLKTLIKDIYRSQGVDSSRIVYEIFVEDVFLDLDTATSCGLIINELVSNSIDHAFPKGKKGLIKIEISQNGDDVSLKYTDNGIGFPEKFDLDNVDTLGLQLVKTLVDEMDGVIKFNSDKASEFMINFNKEYL